VSFENIQISRSQKFTLVKKSKWVCTALRIQLKYHLPHNCFLFYFVFTFLPVSGIYKITKFKFWPSSAITKIHLVPKVTFQKKKFLLKTQYLCKSVCPSIRVYLPFIFILETSLREPVRPCIRIELKLSGCTLKKGFNSISFPEDTLAFLNKKKKKRKKKVNTIFQFYFTLPMSGSEGKEMRSTLWREEGPVRYDSLFPILKTWSPLCFFHPL
jgi:hypothetical protein